MMDKVGTNHEKRSHELRVKKLTYWTLAHLFQWVVQLKFPELSSFIYFAKLELVLVKYKKENLLCFLFLPFTRDEIKMHAELYFSLREIIPMVSHCQKYAEQIFKFFPYLVCVTNVSLKALLVPLKASNSPPRVRLFPWLSYLFCTDFS